MCQWDCLTDYLVGLSYYTGTDWDPDGDSDEDQDEFDNDYGYYPDVHSRLCLDKENCDICWEDSMRKYHDWF